MKKQTALVLVVIAALLIGAALYWRGAGGGTSRWIETLHGRS